MNTRQRQASILIVDDEPEIRQLLADAFEGEALEVRLAGSGAEAIQLARSARPDLVITDLCLGDCSGLEVMDTIKNTLGDVPTVVITGFNDPKIFSEASRRKPIDLMTKPLNIERLQTTVWDQLATMSPAEPEPSLTDASADLTDVQVTTAELAGDYRDLAEQMLAYQTLIRYQGELIAAASDDDVFRSFFRLFVRESGSVFGAAMVCDAEAQLRIAGRFGVPRPDSLEFCQALAEPMVDLVLTNPVVQEIDGMDEVEAFAPWIQRYLPGLTILGIPLIPAPGEMIGLVLLYRKGEQPFTPEDYDLARMIAFPTATAVRRNE